MHLIASLAAGINGASGGNAALFKRGTSTQVMAWYKDFEASQAYSGAVALDANGGAVVYVNELTDVQVFDLNGVLLREFVAGAEASAVEVISPAFTGTNYVTGQVATRQPTTLQVALDSWFASAGAPDFKVLFGGLPVSLATALASTSGIYFNVQSYGAKGDGVIDNASFIQAAITAATTAGGGTVFFPPGTYRVTTQVTVPANVSVLGCGGTSSKLAIDSAVANCAMEFSGSDTGSRTCVGMWFGAIGQVFVGSLMRVTGAGGRVDVTSCLFGNDAFTKAQLIRCDSAGASSRLVIDKCSVYLPSDANAILQTSSGRITVRDSSFVTTFVGLMGNAMILLQDGGVVDGCQFDASTLTGGTATYISFDGSIGVGTRITNNYFRPFTNGIAIANRTATPGYECWESGNSCGDAVNGGMPLYAETTDGFAPVVQDIGGVRGHMSRLSRSFGIAINGNINIDAKNYGVAVISRYAVGAQVITATAGALGDLLTVRIINNAGGGVAPTFGGNMQSRSGYVAAIPNLVAQSILFQWLPNQLVAGAGAWVQLGVEASG